MQVALVPPQTDLPRHVTVAHADDEGGGMGTVRFAEVADPDTARALIGMHCLVPRGELPEVAAVAVGDGIAGWEVVDAREGMLGTVAGIVENPGQSLLEVARPDGGTLLVPLVDEFIARIDEGARAIEVDLPPGLTDL